MKLKQSVLIMMAAALPLSTSIAAKVETIPVTKDTGAVVAQIIVTM